MQVRVLGPVDVTVDGVPRAVRGLRRKTVLAVLALQADEIVSTDWLIDVVWGEETPTTAANTLQSHMSYLRGVLGDRAAIKARSPGYVLDIGADATDLQLAQRLIRQGKQSADPAVSASHLRAALVLWRDRPLVDVASLVWLDGQAERLAKIRLEAAEALIEARLALGEHAQLVAELERLSEQHPFREHIHRQLMLALYRTGRQVDALAVYQRVRHVLGDELGMDPSPALRDLEAAMLRQDPALNPSGMVITLASQEIAGSRRTAPVDTLGVLEHEHEIAELACAAREAVTGDPREVFTGGNPLFVAEGPGRMRQVVRFAETPAGRVAYAVMGSGPPLLWSHGWVSHLDLMWETPEHRQFVEMLAREHTVIRFDKLGCGLSDRVRTDFTMEFELAVLQALVEHLGLKRFALFGSCEGGQVAMAYAATHPDTVSSLIVYGSCVRGRDLAPDDVRQSVLALVRAHWGLGSRVLADIWLPEASAELTGAFARLRRAAATAEMAASLLDMFYRFDVAEVLPAIRMPTLVAHRRGCRAVGFELGRELGALIPGAQFAALAGRLAPIYAEGADAAASTLLSFLRNQTRHLTTDQTGRTEAAVTGGPDAR